MPRHQNIPAAYLVLFKEQKTLLLRRKNTGFEDGNYGLVSGHVEKGESFLQCMVREAEEEAGILLKAEDLKVAHMMHRKSGLPEGDERVDAFVVARRWEGEIQNKEPHKCNELGWFELRALPENTIGYIRQALEHIQEGEFYSEQGWS